MFRSDVTDSVCIMIEFGIDVLDYVWSLVAVKQGRELTDIIQLMIFELWYD